MMEIETAVTITTALVVGVIAILYRLALTGNHPPLTTHLRGLNPDRTESRSLRVLLLVVTYGAGLYAVFVFNGIVRVPTELRWWMVVAVGIFVIALVTDDLLP